MIRDIRVEAQRRSVFTVSTAVQPVRNAPGRPAPSLGILG